VEKYGVADRAVLMREEMQNIKQQLEGYEVASKRDGGLSKTASLEMAQMQTRLSHLEDELKSLG